MLRDAIDESGLLIRAQLAEAVGNSIGKYPVKFDEMGRGSNRWDEDVRGLNHRMNRAAQRDRRGQSGVNWAHIQASKGRPMR